MVRRATAALTFLLMLHVTALSAGFSRLAGPACNGVAETSAQAPTVADMSGMPGMDMSKAATGGNESDVPGKTGCNLPWALGCASSAPCGPSATIAVVSTRLSLGFGTVRVATRTILGPESPALAPEVPPPRI